jgi:hypothetical protein
MAMLSGTLDEERFETPPAAGALRQAAAAGGRPLRHRPTVLHRLMPVSPRAVSLHVYRPPLRTMGIWDETGMISIMPSAFDVDEEILARVDSPRAESIANADTSRGPSALLRPHTSPTRFPGIGDRLDEPLARSPARPAGRRDPESASGRAERASAGSSGSAGSRRS